jgi:uncharacterized repeat protein (TIGR01451 family)
MYRYTAQAPTVGLRTTWWLVFLSIISVVFTAGQTITNPSPANFATNMAAGIALSWSSTGSTNKEHEVYFGTNPGTAATNLVGTTAQTFWEMRDLEADTTYFWRLVLQDGTNRVESPLWQFRTAPLGPLSSFEWGRIDAVFANRPARTTLTARDRYLNRVTTFQEPVRMGAIAEKIALPRVVISEVNTLRGEIEFLNVSGSTVNLNGWELSVYDKPSWPEPLRTIRLGANTLGLNAIFIVRGGTNGLGAFPSLLLGTNINWGTTADPGAILLRDASGTIVDFVALGSANVAAIRNPASIPLEHWASAPIFRQSETSWSYQRIGNVDQNDSTGWEPWFPSMGFRNTRLTLPFVAGPGAFPVEPATVTNFVNGRAMVDLTFAETNNRVALVARSDSGQAGKSAWFSVLAAPGIEIAVSGGINEGSGPAQGTIRLGAPAERDTTVFLSATDASEVTLPTSLLFRAGQVETNFTIGAVDDSLLDGTQIITLLARAEGYSEESRILAVHDNEVASIQLQVPARVAEGGSASNGVVTLSSRADKPVRVTLSFDPPGQIDFPGTVIIPAGSNSVSFPVSAVDDRLLEGTRTANGIASVQGWNGGAAGLEVLDNETASLSAVLPGAVVEGTGRMTNAGRVFAGGILLNNLELQIRSSAPARLQVPATVTIPAGQSNVLFDVTVTENSTPELPTEVSVTASTGIAGWNVSSNLVAMLDNDPAEIRFSAIGSPQYTDRAFDVTIRALDPAGNVLTNFSGTHPLIAETSEGSLPTDPVHAGPFAQGQWTGPVRVTKAGALVRLRLAAHPGQSAPFNVLWPEFRSSGLATADLLWDATRQVLYATAPTAHPTSIVAIDPVTLTVTNSYPLAISPEKMELSPDGGFIYIRDVEKKRLQRFDLSTRTAGGMFEISTTFQILDFAVIAGASDSVVLSLGDGNWRGLWRFDSGVGRRLEALESGHAPWILETAPGGTIYAFENNNSHPLIRGTSSGAQKIVQGIFGGSVMAHRDGVVYDGLGNAVDGTSLALIGNANGLLSGGLESAFVETDPGLNRILYLAGNWFSSRDARLVAYDRTTFSKLAEVTAPQIAGTPIRFIRTRPGQLVFNTTAGQLWVVESERLQPSGPPADLSVHLAVTTVPQVLGQTINYSLTVSNAGAARAGLLTMTNTLPPDAVILSNSVSAGQVEQIGSTLVWTLDELAAGATQTLTGSVQFDTAGEQWIEAQALAYERDPNFSNNVARSEFFVQLPGDSEGAFLFKLANNDLAYDPARDRLLLAVQTGISVFDPYIGRSESLHPLSERPFLIEKTDGGEYLYVSYKEKKTVGRLNLGTLGQESEFSVGHEYHFDNLLPYYAAAMAPIPGNPLSVAVWQMRAEHPIAWEFGRGIAIFDNGVARINVAEINGRAAYSLTFDPARRELYAFAYGGQFEPRDLARYGISSNGLTLLEKYPPLSQAVAEPFQWRDGKLLNSAGRWFSTQPFGMATVYPDSHTARLAEYDASAGRVFFVSGSGMDWILQAYDTRTSEPVGSVHLPALTGVPSRLILFGTSGLALRTSENQLCIVRTALRQPGQNADLGVQVAASTNQARIGEQFSVTLTVTNSGPVSAHNVSLKTRIPTGTKVGPISASVGASSVEDDAVTWTHPLLAANQAASLVLTCQSTNTGSATFVSVVQTASVDPVAANNKNIATLNVSANAAPLKVTKIPLGVIDLEWSRVRGELLALCGAGSEDWRDKILALDPETFVARPIVFAGNGASRLELARDEGTLYAGSGSGIRALDPAALSLKSSYVLDRNGNAPLVSDLCVLPSTTNSIALLQHDRIPFGRHLAIYDSGIMRSNIGLISGLTGDLQVGDAASAVYLHTAPGFASYVLDGAGVKTRADFPNLLRALQLQLAWAGDVMVASDGTVFDPDTGVALRKMEGVTLGSAVYADQPSGRVFFAHAEGGFLVLKAFDLRTALKLGEERIDFGAGYPVRLLRAGERKLAFNTTEGDIAIVETTLLPSSNLADLALILTAENASPQAGRPFAIELTVTNRGPGTVTDAQLVAQISNSTSLTATNALGIPAQISGQNLTWPIGPLPANGTASIRVQFTPVQAGAIQISGNAFSSVTDPDAANNSVVASYSAARILARGESLVLNEAAADLIHDASTDRLYLAGQGKIAVLNPANATVETNWTVTGTAGRLALPDSNEFLFVALNHGQSIQRLRTSNGQLDLEIPLAWTDFREMKVAPGSTRSILIGNSSTTMVLDDAIARTNSMIDSAGSFSLAFGDSPNVAYRIGSSLGGGNRLDVLEVDAAGVRQEGHWRDPLGYNIGSVYFAEGRLYTDSGIIVDPSTLATLSQISGLGQNSRLALDLANSRLLYLTKIGQTWQLRGYDKGTGAFLGSQNVPSVLGTPSRLVHWGEDGVAFATTSNQVVLARTTLLPIGGSADLSLLAQPPVAPIMLGATQALSFAVTNAGPSTATGVVVNVALPENVRLVSAQIAGGAVTTNGHHVAFRLPQLPAGAIGTAHVQIVPERGGILTLLASVLSENPDPQPANEVELNLQVETALARNQAAVLNFDASDMVFDPKSGMIYAIGNQTSLITREMVFTLNPTNGVFESLLHLGRDLTQLAISDDGTRLYVLGDQGRKVHSVNLPQGIPGPVLDIANLPGGGQPSALEVRVVPGRPDTLAAIVTGAIALQPPPATVIFRNGQMLSNAWFWSTDLAVISSNRLVGYDSSSTRMLEIREDGLHPIGQEVLGAIYGETEVADGKIYSSGGFVADGMTLARLRDYGISGPVAPNLEANRVSFVENFVPARISVFEEQTGLKVGTATLPRLDGGIVQLLSAGGDRLAARTRTGEIILLRTDLIPTGPKTDLALGYDAATARVGEPIQVSLTVTNLGSNRAENVVLTNSLPEGFSLASWTASQGTVSMTNGVLRWTIGTLAAGSVATSQVQFQSSTAGTFEHVAQVSGDVTDTNSVNNSIRQHWIVNGNMAGQPFAEYRFVASDVVWSSQSERLYLSLAQDSPGLSNAVIALDPATGTFGAPLPVGPNPGDLEVSENGEYLYVGLNGTASVARVSIASNQVEKVFTLDFGYQARDIKAVPGRPRDIAVALEFFPWNGVGDHAGVALYRDGVLQPRRTPAFSDVLSTIVFAADGTRLYGYNGLSSEFGFRRADVLADGLQIADARSGIMSGYGVTLERSGPLLYSSSGVVFDPETLAITTNLTQVAANSAAALHGGSGLWSFAAVRDERIWLQQFSLTNFSLKNEFRVPSARGTPRRLVPWGADGLALLTSSNQLIVLRPALAQGDLKLANINWPASARPGQLFSGAVRVTNGNSVATELLLTNTLPAGVRILEATTSAGRLRISESTLVLEVDEVPANGTVTLNLSLMTTNLDSRTITNRAIVSGAFSDLTPANNTVLAVVEILGDTDRDGLPDDWERLYQLDPTNKSDAPLDSDGDGLSNLQEFAGGTNPRDATSPLRLKMAGTGPTLALEFGQITGRTYNVLRSTNSAAGPWTQMQRFTGTTNGAARLNISATNRAEFYQVTVE